MAEPISQKKTALGKFGQISDVLAVPTIGKPLPAGRKWTLPCPDRKALADHPAGPLDKEVKECLEKKSSQSEPSISGQSSAEGSPKQTGGR